MAKAYRSLTYDVLTYTQKILFVLQFFCLIVFIDMIR